MRPERELDQILAQRPDSVPLASYSAALDEIYALRRALAYEAIAIESHLDYKTFPKSRREVAERQVERMQAAARGDALRAYADRPSQSMRYAFRQAGAKETMTRHEWEKQKGIA